MSSWRIIKEREKNHLGPPFWCSYWTLGVVQGVGRGGEQSKKGKKKGEESFGIPFLMPLLDARGWAMGRGRGMGLECAATKWIALSECLVSHQTVSPALFITNPTDEPQRPSSSEALPSA
ncbi:hypothetical protein CDAR_292291 [Caerostris darwini]|uniref:Uncharacterized protein n=1 Tax=Caerostris darwini TaxID=1538125 RepID=A0AAV4UCW6_9ARAC|nr:hypothetical protein CDAR_292291 [Caerostris darwini]